jgi:hypothetical protein
MARTRVWLAVSPLVLGGVLAAHALAYRLTGTPAEPLHGYLEHAPQLLALLALAALAGAGMTGRLGLPQPWTFPLVAVATYVGQEHVERLVHTGRVPWLLTAPAFLVGLLLQLPVALVVWLLARRLLDALAELPLRRPALPRLLLATAMPATGAPRPAPAAAHRGRAPPLLDRP